MFVDFFLNITNIFFDKILAIPKMAGPMRNSSRIRNKTENKNNRLFMNTRANKHTCIYIYIYISINERVLKTRFWAYLAKRQYMAVFFIIIFIFCLLDSSWILYGPVLSFFRIIFRYIPVVIHKGFSYIWKIS